MREIFVVCVLQGTRATLLLCAAILIALIELLQQLFVKTGVRTRSQLVRVALEEYGAVWGLRHP